MRRLPSKGVDFGSIMSASRGSFMTLALTRSPWLLPRPIEKGVQEPRAGEDGKDDRPGSGGSAGEHEHQTQEKERVDAGLGVAMGAEHAGDLRRVDLRERGAESDGILLVHCG